MLNGQSYCQRQDYVSIIQPGQAHTCRAVNQPTLTLLCFHFTLDDPLFVGLLQQLEHVIYAGDSEIARSIRPALDKLMVYVHVSDTLTVTERLKIQSAFF